ncbi:hypothetical protein AMECASPLE_039361 [Ameca splendens]|uniref:Uncharacterized protein n=1 Tax=Ameca splendens TaxID=208324 RepID=A0ABV1AFH8_9TELE
MMPLASWESWEPPPFQRIDLFHAIGRPTERAAQPQLRRLAVAKLLLTELLQTSSSPGQLLLSTVQTSQVVRPAEKGKPPDVQIHGDLMS